MDDYIDMGEAIRLARQMGDGVRYGTVLAWCRRGVIESKKSGRAWLVRRSDFLEKVKGRRGQNEIVTDHIPDGMVTIAKALEFARSGNTTVSYFTVLMWCKTGKIPSAYVNGHWYVFAERVLRMAEKMRAARKEPQKLVNLRGRELPELSVTTYQFIVQYKLENDGNTPSLRDIADAIGVASSSTAWRIVQDLEKAGLVERVGKGNGQFVKIVGARWLPPEGGE